MTVDITSNMVGWPIQFGMMNTAGLYAPTGVLYDNVKVTQATTEEEATASCLLYTSPSPRDGLLSRMPSSA